MIHVQKLPGASCYNHDPELWSTPGYNSSRAVPTPENVEAIKICKGCPVRAECLDEALSTEAGWSVSSRHDIWGGLTPKQRTQLDRTKTCETCTNGIPTTPTTRRYCGVCIAERKRTQSAKNSREARARGRVA